MPKLFHSAAVCMIAVFSLPLSSPAFVGSDRIDEQKKDAVIVKPSMQKEPSNIAGINRMTGKKYMRRQAKWERLLAAVQSRSGETVKAHPTATVALIAGLLGWVPGAGIFFGLLAVVFALLALKRIKREPEKWKGRSMARTGLILGIIFFAAWIVIFAIAATITF